MTLPRHRGLRTTRPLFSRSTSLWWAALLALGPAASAQQPSDSISVAIRPTILPVLGVPATVTLDFPASIPAVSAALYLRTTGSGAPFLPFEAEQEAADATVYRLDVPADAFDPAGIDFFVAYETADGDSLTSPIVGADEEPFQLPVVSRRLEAPIVLLPREYRMVSVPAEFLTSQAFATVINEAASEALPGFVLPTASPAPTDVLGDDDTFGPYDVERWRILRWDPRGGGAAGGAYLNGPSEVGPLRPGQGFWLTAATGGSFDVESVYPAGFDLASVSTVQLESSPIEVLLQPGWNQIGSPYLFPIAWEDVEGSPLVDAPVAFEGREYDYEQEVLEPWRGYFVLNRTPNAVPLTFSIPPDAPDPQPGLAARLLDAAGAGAFLLQVRTDEVVEDGATPLRTRNTFVGIGQQEKRIETPASVTGGLTVRLGDADGRALASAITADEAGGSWTLTLRADDAWTRPRRFAVSLDEHGRRPTGWSYRLADAETGEPLALSDGTFRVSVGPGETRRFRLTLGPDVALATEPQPETGPLFGRVGPNPAPAGRAVDVAYRTPGGAAELVVLDLLGRPVRRLPLDAQPGWHETTWDGTARGAAVAPGLYFLHLRTPAGQAVRKLTVVR